ncbi:MAG: zinc ribbon domain-containing protein [Planctomycetes bacterium]|nr:zinc ribbon domain-containing protein [Planctomycetota bacterium]
MPTYEYLCNSCGDRFEKFQSITAETLRKCPNCGKMELKRLIGAGAGVIFKGSGFYETDYRSEGYKQSAKKELPKSESSTDKKDSPSAGDAKTTEKSKTTADTKTPDKKEK